MAFLLSTVKSFLETLKTFPGFDSDLIWEWIIQPEQWLTYAAVLTSRLDWPSVSNTVVHFSPWVSFFRKKRKCLRCFSHYHLDICLVTHEWLHPVPQQANSCGPAFNSHVTDKENIWDISLLSFANSLGLGGHAAEGFILHGRLASLSANHSLCC